MEPAELLMTKLKTIISSLLVLLILCSCATEEEDQWYKGNLHTHTYWSDGDAFPEMVLDWYKNNGYQFVALTDHNTLQTGEKWKKIPKSHIYEQAFDDYLARYGEDWVDYQNDSSGLRVKLKTEAEYAPYFQDENFLILRA